MKEPIRYASDVPITPEAFVDLLRRSSLAERRPVEDRACIEAMLAHADLLVTAWRGAELVGVARSSRIWRSTARCSAAGSAASSWPARAPRSARAAG